MISFVGWERKALRVISMRGKQHIEKVKNGCKRSGGVNEFGQLLCESYYGTVMHLMTLFHVNDFHQGIQLNDILRFLISYHLTDKSNFFNRTTEWDHAFKRTKSNCAQVPMLFCKKCSLCFRWERKRAMAGREFCKLLAVNARVFICMCMEEAMMENKRGWQCGLAPAVNLPQSQMAGPWSLGCDGLALIAGGNPCLWV